MTDRYAVIGNPIAHSKSPQIHTLFAQQTGQDISYEAILVPLDGFAATVERLREEGYKGCNVTVPFKQQACHLAIINQLAATTASAANTLYFNDWDELVADNTDGIGLVRDIRINLGLNLSGKKILVMGAGGAARGVLYPLMDQNAYSMSQQSPELIVIVNRTPQKAAKIINEPDFKKIAARIDSSKPQVTNLRACGYDELAGQQFDVVINATSTGLSDEMPPLPRNDQIPLNPPFTKGEDKIPPFAKGGLGGIFAPGALAYDMMYGRETPFMKFAREHGAAIVADGLGMLVEQAAESFFIWRGVRPETAPVIAKLRETA